MIPTNNHNVDKNSFLFLFNEDIYVIPEETADVQKTKAETPVREEPKTVSEKRAAPEKKTPILPQTPEVISSLVKDYAIIVKNQNELDSGKEFLGKILGAIKLDLHKVDIYPSETAGDEILLKPEHRYIISFGLDASKYRQDLNKVTKKANTTFLFSNSLNDLQKDVEKKKALWAALQQFL